MASGGSSVLDEYEWETLPDMLVARCYSVAAYHEGKLYVFGKQSQYEYIFLQKFHKNLSILCVFWSDGAYVIYLPTDAPYNRFISYDVWGQVVLFDRDPSLVLHYLIFMSQSC